MKMEPLPQPPEGCRILQPAEIVNEGDKVWRPFSAKWSPVRASEPGMTAGDFYAVARPDDK